MENPLELSVAGNEARKGKPKGERQNEKERSSDMDTDMQMIVRLYSTAELHDHVCTY